VSFVFKLLKSAFPPEKYALVWIKGEAVLDMSCCELELILVDKSRSLLNLPGRYLFALYIPKIARERRVIKTMNKSINGMTNIITEICAQV
jgi:hypothetical protein